MILEIFPKQIDNILIYTYIVNNVINSKIHQIDIDQIHIKESSFAVPQFFNAVHFIIIFISFANFFGKFLFVSCKK